MKINVSSVVKSEGAVKDFEGKIIFADVKLSDDELLLNPVDIKGQIKNIGGSLTLDAELKAELMIKCARCLKSFSKTFELQFSENISNSGENEEDILKVESNEVDVTDAVYTNLVLNLENRYLCSDDCKGICPTCGVNLNETDCGCDKGNIDPRLDVLKKLLK